MIKSFPCVRMPHGRGQWIARSSFRMNIQTCKEETNMKHTIWKRGTGALLALLLTLGGAGEAAASEREFTLMELKETHVTLDNTVFPYTGEEIRPQVTVTVEDLVLVQDQDYTLEYARMWKSAPAW